jgi:hypothetical protein
MFFFFLFLISIAVMNSEKNKEAKQNGQVMLACLLTTFVHKPFILCCCMYILACVDSLAVFSF